MFSREEIERLMPEEDLRTSVLVCLIDETSHHAPDVAEALIETRAELEKAKRQIYNLKVKSNSYAKRLVLDGHDDVTWETTDRLMTHIGDIV
jgi:hypothetical protein